MCKLIVGTNKGDGKELKRVLEMQKDDLYKEADGIGAFILTKSGKLLVWRSFDDYNSVFDQFIENISQARLFSIHTRTGTSGETALINVHFFEANGYLLAHNGFATKLSFGNYKAYTKAGEKCDSYRLVEKLPRPLNMFNLNDTLKENGFSGACFVYDKRTKDAYYVVKKKCEAVTGKDFDVFCSYSIDEVVDQEYYALHSGVKVFHEKKEIQLGYEPKEVYEGIYKLNY